jgi:uncharacterized protein (DUF608 family)
MIIASKMLCYQKMSLFHFAARVAFAALVIGGYPVLRAQENIVAKGHAKGTETMSSVEHRSGIPLGGIGTGSVEIRSDGTLSDWQIFNMGPWAPHQPENVGSKNPDMKMSFYLRALKQGGKPMVRRLSVSPDNQDLYNLAWLKNVQSISYTGRFPVATLKYGDEELPLKVRAIFCSPFIPHDSRSSGTPGLYATFHLENCSDEPVSVSVLSTIKNPLAWGNSDRKLTNKIEEKGGSTYLTMRTAAQQVAAQTLGSLCVSVNGGDASWIAGDFPHFLDINDAWWFRGAYGNVHESFLHDFRSSGVLPSLKGSESPESFLKMSNVQIDSMAVQQKINWIKKLREYAYFESLAKRVLEVDRDAFSTTEGVSTFLIECRDRINEACGKERKEHPWGDGALCTSVILKPGEKKDVQFVMSWFFPNHYSALGPVVGHMYENWFRDAEDVNSVLVSNAKPFADGTIGFANSLYETSFGTEMADAWSAQLSTLVKTTWWTKNGDFGVWEGLGCCGFHTTDITYQGSFNIIALFPDLQKRQMEMGARFQREDGRVHHFFAPDLSKVDNGFDRVDMNQQFVLLVCRDYLWTGDKEYLKRMWPHIVRAIANTAELDADGDGLPDHDTRRNTYDAWNFFGTPSYISSLWLSSLRAGIRMAEDLGENKLAASWQKILDKGAAQFKKMLWNGEYFSLWVDKEKRDECCMTDQLSGEWFAQLIGIGHCLPRDLILTAMRAVYRNNFTREGGLINASYPSGKEIRFSTYRNGQACAPWTGIEYAMASMMLEFGLYDEALSIVSTVYDRYLRAGQQWSHVECGSHYYRAMSSWSVLLSATGFKFDAPRGTVTFAPAVMKEPLHAPWISSTGWGNVSMDQKRLEISCTAGTMQFSILRMKTVPLGKVALLNGNKINVRTANQEGLTVAEFGKMVGMKAGDRLVLE